MNGLPSRSSRAVYSAAGALKGSEYPIMNERPECISILASSIANKPLTWPMCMFQMQTYAVFRGEGPKSLFAVISIPESLD